MVQIWHIFFICISVGGHLGDFCFFGCYKMMPLGTCVCRLLDGSMYLLLLGIYLGVEFLSGMVALMVSILRSCPTVFQSTYTILRFCWQCTRGMISLHACQHFYYLLWLLLSPQVWSPPVSSHLPCVLIYRYLMYQVVHWRLLGEASFSPHSGWGISAFNVEILSGMSGSLEGGDG